MDLPELLIDPRVSPGRGWSPYEEQLVAAGLTPIAGADEAGRGACAGPLVAAAVILSPDPARVVPGLDDSKAMSPARRERVYALVEERALAVSVVAVPAAECDQGLQEANLKALRLAVEGLTVAPGFVITDGFAVPGLSSPGVGMWKGDQVAACVAAASIVAKVTRDRLMDSLDAKYPGYGFAVHKGYATAVHQRYLDAVGPCAEHRLSYANVGRAVRGVVGAASGEGLARAARVDAS